jgi:hypothetical protein
LDRAAMRETRARAVSTNPAARTGGIIASP